MYWALKHQNKENIKTLLQRDISLIVSGNYHALVYAIDCNLCDSFIEIAKRKEGEKTLELSKELFSKRAKLKKRKCIMGYLNSL